MQRQAPIWPDPVLQAKLRRILVNLRRVEEALDTWDQHDRLPDQVAAPLVSRQTLTEMRAMLREERERERRRAARRAG